MESINKINEQLASMRKQDDIIGKELGKLLHTKLNGENEEFVQQLMTLNYI